MKPEEALVAAIDEFGNECEAVPGEDGVAGLGLRNGPQTVGSWLPNGCSAHSGGAAASGPVLAGLAFVEEGTEVVAY